MRDETGSVEKHCRNSAVIDTQADGEGSLPWQELYDSTMTTCLPEVNSNTHLAAKSRGMMLHRSLGRGTHIAIGFGSVLRRHWSCKCSYLEYDNSGIVHLKER
jgi:hypothetical protein